MRTKLLMLLIVAVMPLTWLFACDLSKANKTEQAVTKEFYWAGLKYEVCVKLSFEADGKLTGTISSNEYFQEGETVSFAGTFTDNKIQVKFNEEPPVVGAASEWTEKPWRIEQKDGKEVLIIPFFVKNYDTMEWEDTEYIFEIVDDVT